MGNEVSITAGSPILGEHLLPSRFAMPSKTFSLSDLYASQHGWESIGSRAQLLPQQRGNDTFVVGILDVTNIDALIGSSVAKTEQKYGAVGLDVTATDSSAYTMFDRGQRVEDQHNTPPFFEHYRSLLLQSQSDAVSTSKVDSRELANYDVKGGSR